VPHPDQLFRIRPQQLSRLRQRSVARGPLKQDLAEILLQLANHLAHRRLGAVQPRGGAREAALFGHREEGFQLEEVDQLYTPVLQRAEIQRLDLHKRFLCKLKEL
jgi:hypothetical protein